MTSKKDKARMDELARMLDRLDRRHKSLLAMNIHLTRLVEIMAERGGWNEDELDAMNKMAQAE